MDNQAPPQRVTHSVAQLLANLQDERNGIELYHTLAEVESNPKLAEVYRRLAMVEQQHAETWMRQLQAAGIAIPPPQLSWRTRVLLWIARRFGAVAVLPSLASLEQIDAHKYQQEGASLLARDERSHSRLLQQLTQPLQGGLEGGALAQIEGRHRAGGGNALRAAVLGANDGLVSNVSLVMGVAGAALSGRTILVTGLAGLLAGAFSMALGEWLSVQSSRELYARQIAIESAEIAANPAEEAAELSLIYQARGLTEAESSALAARIIANTGSAIETLAREELGIDPAGLGGSAWEAASTSFLLFAIGAVVPVAPFAFLQGTAAIVTSLCLSTLGLFAIGAGITLFTGRSVFFSGMRQVLFGLAAAAITFLLGRLIGVSISG